MIERLRVSRSLLPATFRAATVPLASVVQVVNRYADIFQAMQKIRFLFLVYAALTFGALSSQAGEQRSYRSSAKEFSRRDPVAEATENFRKGEIYIFSAMGVGHYFPGLQDDRLAERIANKYGERPLGGTSDLIESNAHRDYIQAATKYASAYNLQMVKLLREKGRRWPWQRN